MINYAGSLSSYSVGMMTLNVKFGAWDLVRVFGLLNCLIISFEMSLYPCSQAWENHCSHFALMCTFI